MDIFLIETTRPKKSVIRIKAKARANTKNENDRFDRETDIREKRIGIIFKVIYVIALFFAALFTSLSTTRGGGLTDVYILEATATGFLLCLLIYMLVYIFNELKCLKLNSKSITTSQYEKTEESYSFVFTYFTLGSVVSILFSVAVGEYKEHLTQDIAALIIALCAGLAIVLGLIPPNKARKVIYAISSILWTVAAIGIFIGIAIAH